MTSPVTITSHIDSKIFKRFSHYHAYVRAKIWIRPAAFMIILLIAAVICFIKPGTKDGAKVFAFALAALSLGIPGAYFGQFEMSLRNQCKAMKLDLGRDAYTLEFSEEGVKVFDEQNGTRRETDLNWSDFKQSKPDKHCLYLYTKTGNAYLIPEKCTENMAELQKYLMDHMNS